MLNQTWLMRFRSLPNLFFLKAILIKIKWSSVDQALQSTFLKIFKNRSNNKNKKNGGSLDMLGQKAGLDDLWTWVVLGGCQRWKPRQNFLLGLDVASSWDREFSFRCSKSAELVYVTVNRLNPFITALLSVRRSNCYFIYYQLG